MLMVQVHLKIYYQLQERVKKSARSNNSIIILRTSIS